MSDRFDDDAIDLDLPDVGRVEDAEDDEDVLGLDDPGSVELSERVVEDQQGDPFDDAVADDLPLDVEIATDDDVPTILGDDAQGLHDEDLGQELELGEEIEHSFLDDRGQAEEGLEMEGDAELGIDPIPREMDDGGLEGLEDPAETQIDADFPPLDGEEADDDEEIDLGIEIGPPAHPLDVD